MSYPTDKLGDGRTDRRTQATTIPEGQNWPRVKMNKGPEKYHRRLNARHEMKWAQNEVSGIYLAIRGLKLTIGTPK